MLLALAATLSLAVSAGASANCIGSGSFKTCYDTQTGNNYTVQKFGDQTYMQGNNPRTGSTWNQNSNTIGNTTFHNGQSADGNSWSGTSNRIGGTTFNQGIDSRGNPYSSTCNQYGCN